MAGSLRLLREGFGIELRRGTFQIVLDGRTVGSIERHETFETPVPVGGHTLRIQAGRYSSRNHDFECAEGQVASFRCHGALIWPRYVVSIFKPDLAISLSSE